MDASAGGLESSTAPPAYPMLCHWQRAPSPHPPIPTRGHVSDEITRLRVARHRFVSRPTADPNRRVDETFLLKGKECPMSYCKENSSMPAPALAAQLHWVFDFVMPESQLSGVLARR